MIDPDGWWGTRPIESGYAIGEGAHRTWLDPERPMEGYQGAERQEDIDFCESCNVPREVCKGEQARCRAWRKYNAPRAAKSKIKPPSADPCAACYTRRIGVCVDGTCDRRRRWEKSRNQLQINEEIAKTAKKRRPHGAQACARLQTWR